jgi:2'-hydroxyisoflavone reductase
MSTDRRSFLKWSAAFGGALGLGPLAGLAWADVADSSTEPRPRPRHADRAAKALDILILGGTGFTGPEQVEYAIARGHRVTLFNRNKTRPDFFKGKVAELIGDLNDDVSALAGRKFDVVIDNPTTLPAWVRNAAKHLAGNTSQYIFISTQDVYRDGAVVWADETYPLKKPPAGLDPFSVAPADARRGGNYGILKAVSEAEVERQYPGINTIIRPGLIVGPLDKSDRFTYWPVRIDRGGEVLAPGNPTDPAQIIDVRDLAEWMIRMAENRAFGAFNAVGPQGIYTMGELLYGIKAITTSGPHFTWVPGDFLREQKIRQWRDMPVWFEPVGNNVGASAMSNEKAIAKGLTFRPLAVTAADTLAWHRTRPAAEQKALADGTTAGITAAREAEVLAAWKAKQKAGSQ